MFSSDYPHPEGGRDPIAKFEATMSSLGPADRDRFDSGNMEELLVGRWRLARPRSVAAMALWNQTMIAVSDGSIASVWGSSSKYGISSA